jgi:signal transduction histidine kinase
MREIVMTGFADYLSTGTSDLLGYWIAASMMRSDGSEFQAEIRMVPIGPVGNREPSILTIFVRDTTARLDAEREVETYQYRLRSLMTELVLTEERERRALAVDIHDGLTQTLALIQIKLSSMRRAAAAAQQSSFDVIERIVQQANHAARSITFELSPPVLHDLGLEPALQWLVENIQTRYGVEIDLEAEGLLNQADEQTRVILFRSIRELLINATKHAGTPHVRLRLQSDEDQFEAAIEDDGVGMEPEKATVQGSGLFSIQERLNHVGGSMRIESAPGKGTRVRLRAPLARQATTSMRTGP